MATRVYTRCMDGHYFPGVLCPNDGYVSDASEAVSAVLEGLGTERPTLALLRERGVDPDLLRYVLIIEQELAEWPPAFPIEITEMVE